MTEWGKPKHKTFYTLAWKKSGWGKHDTVKVPCRPVLLKRKTNLPLSFDLPCLKTPFLKIVRILVPSINTPFAKFMS